MTQAELAAMIAKEAGVGKTTGLAVLKRLVSEITKELKRGNDVRITGLGTFKATKRGARKARNPRTGETIKLKASKQAKFTPSATLKAILNPTRGGAGGAGAKAGGAVGRATAQPASKRAVTKRGPAGKTPARKVRSR